MFLILFLVWLPLLALCSSPSPPVCAASPYPAPRRLPLATLPTRQMRGNGTPPLPTTRYLCDYIADRYTAEISLSQGGLWATLLTDVLVTARERAYGSIADQSVDRLCALASRLDLAVREDVFNDATVRDVQRCAAFVFCFCLPSPTCACAFVV